MQGKTPITVRAPRMNEAGLGCVETRGSALTVECNLLVSILKLSKDGPASIEDIKREARIPAGALIDLLEKLQTENLLKLQRDTVDVSQENRLNLAVRAILLGADVEAASCCLRWQEFEGIAAAALRNNGFEVRQNLRFKHAGRRWEVDVVGCRKPLVVCVDCKDWHHGLAPSAMKRVVEAQVERTRALADALPAVSLGLECVKWSKAKFVPVVLVLIPSRFKFCDDVAIVPVLQLQDFLNQVSVEVESLRYFQTEFAHLSHDFKERSSGELQGGNQA
jgi:Holliday junction resolvase-like predicted endonuclease